MVMENEYRGALLGAAIGDALGMPNETMPASRCRITKGYTKAARNHPNSALSAGSYTDDTQITLMLCELFVSGNYSAKNYAAGLKKLHLDNSLRFPDGTIISACRHMVKDAGKPSGCNSTTTGCIPVALAFALTSGDIVDMREKLIEACSVTHTNPAAHAAAVSFATLIKSALNGDDKPLYEAQKNAFLEDEKLGMKTGDAISLADEGASLETAISYLGNDVSVYQTLPLAYYLIERFGEEDNFLNIAASVGGNSDTVGFICGAWMGATYGASGLDDDLLLSLENRESIETLIERMWRRFGQK